MEERILSTRIEVYRNESDLSDDDQQLLQRAKEQVAHAYAPYSKFKVGAAIRLADGKILTGSNLENAAYPMCLCAEQTAMGAAASRFPNVPVVSLAVTVENEQLVIDQPAGPCGACRQIISEAEDRYGQPISIIMRGATGPIFKVESAKALLPVSFSGNFL